MEDGDEIDAMLHQTGGGRLCWEASGGASSAAPCYPCTKLRLFISHNFCAAMWRQSYLERKVALVRWCNDLSTTEVAHSVQRVSGERISGYSESHSSSWDGGAPEAFPLLHQDNLGLFLTLSIDWWQNIASGLTVLIIGRLLRPYGVFHPIWLISRDCTAFELSK